MMNNKVWVENRHGSMENFDELKLPERIYYDLFKEGLSEEDKKRLSDDKVSIGFDSKGFYLKE